MKTDVYQKNTATSSKPHTIPPVFKKMTYVFGQVFLDRC